MVPRTGTLFGSHFGDAVAAPFRVPKVITGMRRVVLLLGTAQVPIMRTKNRTRAQLLMRRACMSWTSGQTHPLPKHGLPACPCQACAAWQWDKYYRSIVPASRAPLYLNLDESSCPKNVPEFNGCTEDNRQPRHGVRQGHCGLTNGLRRRLRRERSLGPEPPPERLAYLSSDMLPHKRARPARAVELCGHTGRHHAKTERTNRETTHRATAIIR